MRMGNIILEMFHIRNDYVNRIYMHICILTKILYLLINAADSTKIMILYYYKCHTVKD